MKYLATLLMSTMCAINSYAQIGEWIADQIETEIRESINPIINYNSNNLGYFGNFLWESVVNEKCESDLRDKIKEFENFNINSSYLNSLSEKYTGTISWKNYSDITSQIRTRSNSYFHQKANIKMCNIADKKINNYAVAFIDSCSSASEIVSLESVLSKAVFDSLDNFAEKALLCDSLLIDLQKKSTLAILLNNHPEALRVYYNTLGIPALRTQPQHLYYWAVTVGTYRKGLPKKNNLANPFRLMFVKDGNAVAILDGTDNLGKIRGNELYVNDINLMNFPGRPNTTYIYDNNRWKTDRLGRVISASQKCSKDNKKKCKQKNLLKPKEISVLKELNKTCEQAYFNSPEYGAPQVLLNTYVYTKSKENKKAANEAKKELKTNLKTHVWYTATANVVYADNKGKPAEIFVNNSTITNPITSITTAPTQPDTKSVRLMINQNKVTRTPKGEILKATGDTRSNNRSNNNHAKAYKLNGEKSQIDVPRFSGNWESTNPDFYLSLSINQHSEDVEVIVCQIYRWYAWNPKGRIKNGKLILDDDDSEFPFHAEFVLRDGKLTGQCRAFGGPKNTNFSGNLTLKQETSVSEY